MKRLAKQIISIFFLISAVYLPERLAAAVSIAPGLTLENDESGYDQEYLSSIVRQLDRYARMAKLRRSSRDIVIVANRGKFCGFTRNGQLRIPGTGGDWLNDAPLRRKLVALLASHRFGFHCPPDSPGVAWWMLYGLEAEVAAGVTSGQYLVANRDYRWLSELCAVNGKMPDFAAMCRMGEINEAAMRQFAGEQARLLLIIMAENGRIGELFKLSCQGGKPDALVNFYASADEAQQELSRQAMPLIWNRYHPMPGNVALKKLPELTRCFIPGTDAQGRPVADFKECKWEEFADALKHPRTDHLSLRKNFAAKFISLGKMLTVDEAVLCHDLAAEVMNFGVDKDLDGNKKRFGSKLAGLEKRLQLRIAREKFLHSVLLVKIPVPDNFRLHFDSVNNNHSAAGRESMEFLREVMQKYLQ